MLEFSPRMQIGLGPGRGTRGHGGVRHEGLPPPFLEGTGDDSFVFAEDNKMTSVSGWMCVPFHPCIRPIFCLKVTYKMIVP